MHMHIPIGSQHAGHINHVACSHSCKPTCSLLRHPQTSCLATQQSTIWMQFHSVHLFQNISTHKQTTLSHMTTHMHHQQHDQHTSECLLPLAACHNKSKLIEQCGTGYRQIDSMHIQPGQRSGAHTHLIPFQGRCAPCVEDCGGCGVMRCLYHNWGVCACVCVLQKCGQQACDVHPVLTVWQKCGSGDMEQPHKCICAVRDYTHQFLCSAAVKEVITTGFVVQCPATAPHQTGTQLLNNGTNVPIETDSALNPKRKQRADAPA